MTRRQPVLSDEEISALMSEAAYYGCVACNDNSAIKIINDALTAQRIARDAYDFVSCTLAQRVMSGAGSESDVRELESYPERLLREIEAMYAEESR